MPTLKSNHDYATIIHAIKNGREFSNSGRTLRGVPYFDGGGRYFSPNEYSLVTSKYVIYSYATPIAWLLSDGSWYYNNDEYSRTTTSHQAIVRHVTAGQ
jgi:hypothetical protein